MNFLLRDALHNKSQTRKRVTKSELSISDLTKLDVPETPQRPGAPGPGPLF